MAKRQRYAQPRLQWQHPLRAYRAQHGLTLGQFAEAAGSTPATISRIERGKQRPSLDLLLRLSTVTGDAVPAQAYVNYIAWQDRTARPPPRNATLAVTLGGLTVTATAQVIPAIVGFDDGT
jgi:transcriptional regulator with XRE-family HTH domain